MGEVEIDLLMDGYARTDGGGMFGLVPKLMWERKHAADDNNCVALRVNSLLIRDGEHVIVVDTGYGAKFNPRMRSILGIRRTGELPEQLRCRGVDPAQVKIVLNTHLHSDHSGGNTLRAGQKLLPTFPNADYIVQAGEWQSAMNANERTRATYLPENLLPVEEAGRLALIDGDAQITPHVRALVTPGHTPHHQSVLIESEGEKALYTADISPFAIHIERLAWVPAYDLEPMVTIETRRWVQEWSAESGMLLIFPHDPEIGMGRLKYDSGRYWIDPVLTVETKDSE